MSDPSAISISIETDAAADDTRKTVYSGLNDFNTLFAGPMDYSLLTIGARDSEENIIGGLVAHLQPGWKWMQIERLWILESHRRAGIGRRLLDAAETQARKLGCLHSGVATFEFQARGFYEKHGYPVYGVQEDYPAGHRKFLLRKTFR